MRRDWLKLCEQLSNTEATYWSGGKKIIREVSYRFPDPMGPLTLDEIGYSDVKMTLLRKAYVHEESLSAAVDQWNNRRNYKPKSHWSTGFSCYNHILKSHSNADEDYDGLGSVMGPCLQAVTISHTINGTAEIEVFYRTTEIFKKFPADLILLRDHMLNRFDFERTPLAGMTIRASNVTVSPTYAPTMFLLVKDPIRIINDVAKNDPKFHRVVCRWMVNILQGPESKFNQARRTQRAVKRLMSDERRDMLISYISKTYPEYVK